MQGSLDAMGFAGQCASRRHEAWSHDRGDDPALVWQRALGSLLEHRLTHVGIRNTDVPSQLEQLALREPIADVPLARLQLGRTLDNPFDGGTFETGLAHFFASSSAGAVVGMGRGAPVEAGSWWAPPLRLFMKSMNGESRSSGTGRTSVDLFSAATSTTVCR